MIKLLLKIVSIIVLIALVIFAFIKLLPWAIAVVALLALAKFGHDWLCRQGIITTPSTWWAWWKKSDRPQTPPPQ